MLSRLFLMTFELALSIFYTLNFCMCACFSRLKCDRFSELEYSILWCVKPFVTIYVKTNNICRMYQTTFNARQKLWSGKSVPMLYNQKISIGHGLLRAMKASPQKIAQVKHTSL